MTGFTMSSSSVLNELEEEILSGRLPAGSKLPSERQLAEQYGVSRPTIRQALLTLAERHLIDIFPGRGSFVRSLGVAPSPTFGIVSRRRHITPHHVVEARIAIERSAVQLAAERAEEHELSSMEAVLVRLEASEDRLEQVRLDLAFHYALARAAHNPVIDVLFGSIASLTTELMLRSVSDAAVRSRSHPYHRTIFEAVRDGRAEDAAQAMFEHLNVGGLAYGDDYDRSLDALAHRALERLLGPGKDLEDVLADLLPPDGQVR